MSESEKPRMDGTVETAGVAGKSPPVRQRSPRVPKELSEQAKNAARESLDKCLQEASRLISWYKLWHRLLTGTNILFGAFATIISTIIGAGGQRAADTVPGGWQMACFAAAACSGLVTISSLFSSGFKITETLTECLACKTALALLRIDFEDTISEKGIRELKRIRATYGEILARGD
jgi:hypothetical protein